MCVKNHLNTFEFLWTKGKNSKNEQWVVLRCGVLVLTLLCSIAVRLSVLNKDEHIFDLKNNDAHSNVLLYQSSSSVLHLRLDGYLWVCSKGLEGHSNVVQVFIVLWQTPHLDAVFLYILTAVFLYGCCVGHCIHAWISTQGMEISVRVVTYNGTGGGGEGGG